MPPAGDEIESTRQRLSELVVLHRRTRAWFWRTGLAALAGAAIWIAIYLFSSGSVSVKSSLATLLGAFLMWILFFWSFFLLRKLNRITEEVQRVQQALIRMLAAAGRDSSSPPEPTV